MTRIIALILALSTVVGCATTETTSSTWTATGNWVRPGTIESIREIDRRVEGTPREARFSAR